MGHRQAGYHNRGVHQQRWLSSADLVSHSSRSDEPPAGQYPNAVHNDNNSMSPLAFKSEGHIFVVQCRVSSGAAAQQQQHQEEEEEEEVILLFERRPY